MPKIVITGAESTGKSSLSESLTQAFEGELVEEYARQFVEKYHWNCTYQEIEHIAKVQHEKVAGLEAGKDNYVFIDTYLIILMVWFDEKFNKHPTWLDDFSLYSEIDLFLFCETDIDWKEDGIRRNKGSYRKELSLKYKAFLEQMKLPHVVISGNEAERINQAVSAIKTLR